MTIKEVARLAGVSPAAVSRYLNGGPLSKEKKECIARAIEETGYRPNLMAKTMRTGKVRQVGIIVPRIFSESVNQVMDGITEELIFDCDLLIIDDVGTEITNAFVASQLFLCVSERILRKHSTILSTNLTLQQFKDVYSERTFSRIAGNYRFLKLTGKDIRIQKKYGGK